MAKYIKDGKVIEVKDVRFNAQFLKENKKRQVQRVLKHIDSEILEEAFNFANGIKSETKKTATTSKTKSKKDKSDKKDEK